MVADPQGLETVRLGQRGRRPQPAEGARFGLHDGRHEQSEAHVVARPPDQEPTATAALTASVAGSSPAASL